jgi:hypothetical protein
MNAARADAAAHDLESQAMHTLRGAEGMLLAGATQYADDRLIWSGSYDPQSQALTTSCNPGHVSGPPLSGWWHVMATSYSKVGPVSVRTIVSGSEHRGQGRVCRWMGGDMTPPELNVPTALGPP